MPTINDESEYDFDRTAELVELKEILQRLIDGVETFVTLYEARCKQYQSLPACRNIRRDLQVLAAKAVLSRGPAIRGLYDLFEMLASSQKVNHSDLLEFRYSEPLAHSEPN